MTQELIEVLALLGACVAMFVLNRPRMDVVAILAIVALPMTGVVTPAEALSGFSDPAVILIAALFVIGDGLVRTGVAFRTGDWLVRRAGNSESRLMVLLMLAAGLLGSVMSSTGTVAIFLPVALSVAARMEVAPKRLLMPLCMAALLSGMLTLVATTPNLVVNAALERHGMPGFHFFSFTPIGSLLLALGIAYMLVARNWLKERKGDRPAAAGARRTFGDLIADYRLAGRAHRVRILPGSPLAGRTLRATALRRNTGANVIAIERQGRFSREVLPAVAQAVLMVGDILLIDRRSGDDSAAFLAQQGLEPLGLQGEYFTDRSREVGMVEVALPPESRLIGRTIPEVAFLRRPGLKVIGLRRRRKAVAGDLLTTRKLAAGDTLLVAGAWKSLRQLQSRSRDYLVLSLPAEADEVAPAMARAPFALLALLLMVVLMATGIVPNVTAALIACLLMGATGCITMTGAYRAIHWQSLVLIAGMLPFALALQRTGGIEHAVDRLMLAFGGAGHRTVLAGLFVVTSATGLFISNTATAVLMAPVALSAAARLDVSPMPLAMTVALASSAAFMTPVSSPVNMLVLEPGRFRFLDFVRVGAPFTLLVLLVTVWLVPVLFPF